MRIPARAALPSIVAVLFVAAASACRPGGGAAGGPPMGSDWHAFEGTWTAAGTRRTLNLGGDRRASVLDVSGAMLLAGTSRPAIGFRGEAVVLVDNVTGMVGRAVWTDEHGERVFSELRADTTGVERRVLGTFVGGTGRYAGATGDYEFAWQYLLESEDGTVQGRTVGLHGRIRAGGAP